jgi:two-component system sensor histidine kinase RpfC
MSRWLADLRARLKARPDSEHEQAIVRLVVGTVLFFYLLPDAYLIGGGVLSVGQLYFAVMLLFLFCSALIFTDTVLTASISPTRRVLAAALDNSTVTFFMVQSGSWALPLFLIYIWVALGQGFRFGTKYLLISLVFSVVSFSMVLVLSEFWHTYLGAGIGLMIGMFVLSMYVRSLVTKLFDALARAEAANQAKRRFISVVSHEMRTPRNGRDCSALIGQTSARTEAIGCRQLYASRLLFGIRWSVVRELRYAVRWCIVH